jgi:hypothetical protein
LIRKAIKGGCALLITVLSVLLLPRTAQATTIQVPEGGALIPVAPRGVVCGSMPAGWSLGADGRSVRPPSANGSGPRLIELKVAADRAGCSRAETVTVVASKALPQINSASVVLWADEGRLELKGRNLRGMQVQWQTPQRRGEETCLDPETQGKQEQCVIPVGRDLPDESVLRWAPERGRFDSDLLAYDADGTLMRPDDFVLRPARVVLSNLFPDLDSVDVSQGQGRVALVHPKAVAAVDCGQARCELSDGAVVVRNFSPTATSVTMRLRLGPRYFLAHGNTQDQTAVASLSLLHCPLAIVSGPPLRDVASTQVIVRMDARCLSGSRVRWSADGRPVEVIRIVKGQDATLMLLSVGRVLGERLALTVTRGDVGGTVIGVVDTPTIPAPRPQVKLELPRHGLVDFLPTNREVILTVSGARDSGRFVPLSVPGAYTVTEVSDHRNYHVRGEPGVSGFVSMRFGYQRDDVPAEFVGTNLALFDEQIQRALREASVPARFTTPNKDKDLIQVVCADKHGLPQPLETGKENVIPYDSRSTCRLLIHGDRLRPESGQQEIILDVEVVGADGSTRAASGLRERMILRPGGELRVIPLKGGLREFDHIVVRVAHAIDENHYTLGGLMTEGLPAAQWSMTVKGGWARVYGTFSIPAGLYRVTSPTGQLTLNFGVLSRIVTLDRRGKESLWGIELGLMGMGLLQPANQTQFPATLGAVAGLGLRLPLGGGDTAISVHIWGVYEFRGRYAPDPNFPDRDASHWAVIFGPSVSLGNVGVNF